MLQRNNAVCDQLMLITIDMFCYFFFHRRENSNILVSIYSNEISRAIFGYKSYFFLPAPINVKSV